MEIKPFKMVVTPEQSKKVQEIMFKNEYGWHSKNKYKVTNVMFQALFFSSATKNYLTSGDTGDLHLSLCPKLTYDEFIKLYGEAE